VGASDSRQLVRENRTAERPGRVRRFLMCRRRGRGPARCWASGLRLRGWLTLRPIDGPFASQHW